MSDDETNIINLHSKVQNKANQKESASIAVRVLARAIREMKEGGSTDREIARLLRQAADNLGAKNPA